MGNFRLLACCILGGATPLMLAQVPLGSLVTSGAAGFGTPSPAGGGLLGAIFETRGELSKLPDFGRTLRIGTIYARFLRIDPRPFWEGFPGLVEPQAAFAIQYRGDFQIKTAQTYRFALSSSDGSQLFIDGKLLIDNDGVHDPVEKEVSLPLLAATHQIRVTYFHRARKPVALALRIAEGDSGDWRVFDTAEFGLPPVAGSGAANEDSTLDSPFEFGFSGSSHNNAASRLKLSDALKIDSEASAALQADPRPHQFDFRAAVIQFRNDRSVWQGVLALELPTAALTSSKFGSAHLAIVGLVKDDRGQLVDRLVFDGMRETGQGTIAWTHPMILDPQVYTVDIAIVDKDGGRASTSSIKINPGATPAGLAISDVILVRDYVDGPVRPGDPLIHRGKRVLPQLTDRYAANAHPSVFFVVYRDRSNQAKVVLDVEYKVNGKSIAKRSSDLATVASGDAIALSLEPKIHGGDNEMLVTLTQGKQTVSGSARFSVEQK